ncbi:MAG TPA: hypothetical protein DCG78_07435 [Anaerolineaceae bacterium]|nr:MAG: putative membrane protein [Anaerolineae bacterium 49_20]HAE86314.1 hypothetical protein [Anaerolineaceae bacterium]
MEPRSEPEPQEQTILEYLKQQLSSKKRSEAQVSSGREGGEAAVAQQPFPWLTAGALVLALLAQLLLEPTANRSGIISIVLYVLSLGLLLAGGRRKEWSLELSHPDSQGWRIFTGSTWLVLPGIGFATLSFFMLSAGFVTLPAAFVWAAGVALVILGLWERDTEAQVEPEPQKPSLLTRFQQDRAWFLAAGLVALIVLYFAFSRLDLVPPELMSVQVDHFYTVQEILQGNTALTFNRNLVSEPLQYYWAALIARLGGGELSFTLLKTAYALASLVGTFFLYRLTEELMDRWASLIAAGLFGVAFWPVLQTRAVLGAGLTLPILIPAMYYLLRGLRRERVNHILIAALLGGLGLLTNKVFLIFPLVVLVVLLIWLLHGERQPKLGVFFSLIAIFLLVSAITAMPIVRALTLNPQEYLRPILSRVSSLETPLPGSPLSLFFSNWLTALGIVNWSNRSSWVDGIPLRPAVDWVTGALFILGIATILRSYHQNKDWSLLALVILYPLLLIPSALALAFPTENPSLSRGLGAALPVFVIAALGLYTLGKSLLLALKTKKHFGRVIVIGIISVLILWQNSEAIFHEYPQTYRQNTWNASEMGKVITQTRQNFGGLGGVWVIGYPYWVDARAVAIEAGLPQADLALQPPQLEETLSFPLPKLFLLNPQDSDTLSQLQALYPLGSVVLYPSAYPEKNFLIYTVAQ